ncbi:hypothetical protein PoB_005215700 [Plakobranchus ocellatus]|uniref:Uncharacterized protein n=1 Tax=Plakobranchus ocellatus TaxID=259542 RepID=A0AAV4C320_9GAST|nr:hypothetical protein PoB_005215700 [Plakobranchus ocellatus]
MDQRPHPRKSEILTSSPAISRIIVTANGSSALCDVTVPHPGKGRELHGNKQRYVETCFSPSDVGVRRVGTGSDILMASSPDFDAQRGWWTPGGSRGGCLITVCVVNHSARWKQGLLDQGIITTSDCEAFFRNVRHSSAILPMPSESFDIFRPFLSCGVVGTVNSESALRSARKDLSVAGSSSKTGALA